MSTIGNYLPDISDPVSRDPHLPDISDPHLPDISPLFTVTMYSNSFSNGAALSGCNPLFLSKLNSTSTGTSTKGGTGL